MTDTTTAHPREEFDGYGWMLDLGSWSYILDDWGIAYGTGAWYPYSQSVLLAPDVDYRAWRNEHVRLCPSPTDPKMVTARMHLTLRPQGMGAMTVSVDAELDLSTGATAFRPDDVTGDLRVHALTKTRRIHELLAAERSRRDGTPRRRRRTPVTAHQRWVASRKTL